MTPLLEDRITCYLADHPDSTFWELNRAVTCLEKTMREILAAGPFEERDGRWRIAGTTGKRRGSFGPVLTQKQRILAVLRDGRWHTSAELYRTGCVLHSRISDLRNKDGYLIERRSVGGVGADAHEYRLLGETRDPTGGARVSPSGQAGPPVGTFDGSLAAQTDGQLALTGAEFRRTVAA